MAVSSRRGIVKVEDRKIWVTCTGFLNFPSHRFGLHQLDHVQKIEESAPSASV
jgi:hypothetical protein